MVMSSVGERICSPMYLEYFKLFLLALACIFSLTNNGASFDCLIMIFELLCDPVLIIANFFCACYLVYCSLLTYSTHIFCMLCYRQNFSSVLYAMHLPFCCLNTDVARFQKCSPNQVKYTRRLCSNKIIIVTSIKQLNV